MDRMAAVPAPGGVEEEGDLDAALGAFAADDLRAVEGGFARAGAELAALEGAHPHQPDGECDDEAHHCRGHILMMGRDRRANKDVSAD
jgi:hypothetical protein